MRHPLRWIAFWGFVLSLFLPVFQGSDLKGYHVVLFGAVGLIHFNVFLGLPWLANPAFFLAYRMRGGLPRTIVVILSLILASFAWGIRELPQDLAENIHGVSPDWGLRIWYLAFVILAVDALLGRFSGVRRRKKKQPVENSTAVGSNRSPQPEETHSAML